METIARNLLILKQFEEISQKFKREKIDYILLKGIALITLFPEYIKYRQMEDIDLLIKPEHLKLAKLVLMSMGYKKAKQDPYAFWREGSFAYVDLCDGFWYLNKKENQELWKNRMKNFLSYEDFFIHTIAHSYIHHSEIDEKWLSDINIICSKWQKKINWSEVEDKLKKYGIKPDNKFVNLRIPLKGHLARFFLLPIKKKFVYITKTFFPENEFIKNRYDVKNFWSLIFWRIFRPVELILKTCKIAVMFCVDKLRFLY